MTTANPRRSARSLASAKPRCAVVLAALLLANTASAAPKTADARAAFDRGVAAYKKGDYSTASDMLGRSFTLEADADTLYAWAQTERKLNNCVKASELYGRLLEMDLPSANKSAVQQQIDECTALLAAEKAKPEPTVTPAPTTTEPRRDGSPSRWKNPVGLTLVALGVGGLAAGGVFLVQANAADSDAANAATYADFKRFDDRAASRGRLGVIATASGAALLAVGIVYIVTRKPAEELPVAILVEESGASFVAAGRF